MLYAKADSSFGSPAGKHFPTIAGGHAAAKTVRVFTRSVRGLVCPFHDPSPLNFLFLSLSSQVFDEGNSVKCF